MVSLEVQGDSNRRLPPAYRNSTPTEPTSCLSFGGTLISTHCCVYRQILVDIHAAFVNIATTTQSHVLSTRRFTTLASAETGPTRLLADMPQIRSAFREACGDTRRRDFRGEARGIRNPYFVAYDEVAKLSRLILADAGAAMSPDDEEFSALLFDVSLLFEHYVRKLLRNEGLKLEPKQPSDPVRYPNGNNGMAMRPDIILHGDTRTLILDVKYKRWERWRERREIQRADLFQVSLTQRRIAAVVVTESANLAMDWCSRP